MEREYAIVDIETTGGYAAAHGITEISIFVHNGEEIIEHYETLINPHQPIPHFIQTLTGITNEMAAQAPSFDEVADNIYHMLQNRIFVAHNVNFDYSFVKHHLEALGYTFQNKKLCTVRLSKKVFPDFKSHSLGNLCRNLNITINNRHRAGGDALATAQVFELILKNNGIKYIEESLKKNSKEHALPINLAKEEFDKLPYTPGVYYFHNEKGKIIYVGKAKNIKYRVRSHFMNNSIQRQKQEFLRNIYSISFEECGTELMAYLLEAAEIKKYWPQYNRSMKRFEQSYGIYEYEDTNGFLHLCIEKKKKHLEPLFSFNYLPEGQNMLSKLMKEFSLCVQYCHRANGKSFIAESCTCKGACTEKEKSTAYNKRVKKAIQALDTSLPSFALIDKGINNNEKSCVLIEKGRFFGMGYLPSDLYIKNIDEIKNYITAFKENDYMRGLVMQYSENNKEKIIRF